MPIEQLTDGSGTPTNPKKFHRDMAERITKLVENPDLAKKMGKAGRKRVEQKFSWQTVADKTVELYRSLL